MKDGVDGDDAHDCGLPSTLRAPGDGGDDQRANRLVKHGEDDIHAAHDGGDAEQDLGAERRVDGLRRAAVDRLDLAGEDDQRRDHYPRPPAMEEVKEEGVVGQREADPLRPVDAVGYQPVIHQRPAVRDIAGVEPRDPGAEQQLDEQDCARDQGGFGQSGRAALTRPGELPEIERGPDQRGHDEQCEQQVRGQAEMADIGPVDEARHHHVPAEQALAAAEQEQRDQPPAIALGNGPLHREPGEREGEGKADQPADQPVDPFPEEDELILGEVHARRAVDLAIFGGRLVKVEGLLPLFVGQRRDCAADRIPFGDRKPAFGQAGDPADHDHQEHQPGDEHQPVGDGERAGMLLRRGSSEREGRVHGRGALWPDNNVLPTISILSSM